jgi:hypothetical protein
MEKMDQMLKQNELLQTQVQELEKRVRQQEVNSQ